MWSRPLRAGKCFTSRAEASFLFRNLQPPDVPLKSKLFLLVLSASFAVSGRAADVVINEVMYHPSSENVLEEYIELFNRGSVPVDLSGWKFTKGVDYTFGNVVIAPGSYLVAAADLAAFQAKYPGVANVVGNWTGTLRNSGEEIELENASGGTEDSLTYANEGNWGVRRRSL